jgi:hypothetical protein
MGDLKPHFEEIEIAELEISSKDLLEMVKSLYSSTRRSTKISHVIGCRSLLTAKPIERANN